MRAEVNAVTEVAQRFSRDQFSVDPPVLRGYVDELVVIAAGARRDAMEQFYETLHDVLSTICTEYPPASPSDEQSRAVLKCFRSDWPFTVGHFSRNWILIACIYLSNRDEVAAWLRERSTAELDEGLKARILKRAEEVESAARSGI